MKQTNFSHKHEGEFDEKLAKSMADTMLTNDVPYVDIYNYDMKTFMEMVAMIDKYFALMDDHALLQAKLTRLENEMYLLQEQNTLLEMRLHNYNPTYFDSDERVTVKETILNRTDKGKVVPFRQGKYFD